MFACLGRAGSLEWNLGSGAKSGVSLGPHAATRWADHVILTGQYFRDPTGKAIAAEVTERVPAAMED